MAGTGTRRRPAKRTSGSADGRPVDAGRAPGERSGAHPAVHPGVFRRRRLLAVLLGVLVVAGLAVGGRMLVYDSGLADVTGVDVSGAVTIPVDTVVATAAVPAGGPLAEVDTAAVAARVAALPAVASVQVSQSWPHRVTVAVVERTPVATVADGASTALVDTTGTVYAGTAPPGLPRLAFGGVGPDDPATRAAVAALADVPVAVRPDVRTVDATSAGNGAPGQVTFGLTDDRRVVWGSPERGAEKAAVLVPLLTQHGHVFDVASPDLPTIRR